MATRRIDLAKEPAFAIGVVAVDPAHRLLTKAAGLQIVVEHRMMQVLIAFAHAHGMIITRDELTELCWDGRVVGEDAINRVISRLRRTAEELGGDVYRIETISKVGYRMVLLGEATAQPTEGQISLNDKAQNKTLCAGRMLTEQPETKTSAVPVPKEVAKHHSFWIILRKPSALVFTALLFVIVAAGILLWSQQVASASQSMTVRLSGYRLLSASLPATFRESINAEIVAAFNVDGIVAVALTPPSQPSTGTAYSLGGAIYRIDDGSIRVITQLINERSGVVLWSDSSDYAADQATKVPRKVAVDVGTVVRCGLSGAATYRKTLPDPVLSNYLQYCREYWSYGGTKTLHSAQRVVAEAPDFSWGWSAVGNGFVQSLRNERDSQRAAAMREAGLVAQERALQLDPRNSEALAHKAYLIDQRDWATQEALFKAAVMAKPLDCGCEHYGYGLKLQSVGRLDNAVDQFRSAINMLALWPDSQFALADALLAKGHADQAKASFAASIELSNDPDFDKWIAVNEGVELGDYKGAMIALRSPKLQLSDESRAALQLGYEALGARDPKTTARAIRGLRALPTVEKSSIVVTMLGALGANNAALDAVGKRPWLFWRRSMRGVLDEPRFRDVAQELGLMTYWKLSRTKPDVCMSEAAPPFCRMI